MKHILTLLTIMLWTSTASAQAIEVVTNINMGSTGFNPYGITVCNNSLFFGGLAEDGFPNSLFISDGTMAGTLKVKRINQSTSYSLNGFTAFNNKLIFADYQNFTGELWSSDGTSAGTVPFAPVLTSNYWYSLLGAKFVELNNKLYFAGGDTSGQTASNFKDQLWVTDGTGAGTMLVKTINPTGRASVSSLYTYNGNIYFTANDGVNGAQLWISDGSAANTKMLKVIDSAQLAGDTYIDSFTPFNNKLYFVARDSAYNSHIWFTDGTTEGTNRLTNGNYNTRASNLTVFNSKLYFSAVGTTHLLQLWSSDGTTGGTGIEYAESDMAYQVGFQPTFMTEYNGSLYMRGNDSIHKGELWISDGTAPGTQRVTHTHLFNPTGLTTLGNKLVFIAYDSIAGWNNVFISDGTEAGTLAYGLPNEDRPDFTGAAFVPFNNALYFKASYFYNGGNYYELYRVILNPVGIQELNAEKSGIYPNPASDYINIDRPISSVQIYDLSGRECTSVSYNGSRVSVAGMSPGIYVLRAIDEQGKYHINKFVKE